MSRHPRLPPPPPSPAASAAGSTAAPTSATATTATPPPVDSSDAVIPPVIIPGSFGLDDLDGTMPMRRSMPARATIRSAQAVAMMRQCGAGKDKLPADQAMTKSMAAAANDSLSGGAGDDQLDGGTGAEQAQTAVRATTSYFVDNKNDVVIELPGEGFDRIVSTVSFTIAANVEVLDLEGSPPVSRGAALDGQADILIGTMPGAKHAFRPLRRGYPVGRGRRDRLIGRQGNDALDGGKGRDISLLGGSGKGYIEGRHGNLPARWRQGGG